MLTIWPSSSQDSGRMARLIVWFRVPALAITPGAPPPEPMLEDPLWFESPELEGRNLEYDRLARRWASWQSDTFGPGYAVSPELAKDLLRVLGLWRGTLTGTVRGRALIEAAHAYYGDRSPQQIRLWQDLTRLERLAEVCGELGQLSYALCQGP